MTVADFTCRETCDLLVPFEDGELGPSETALVQRHLEACAACARRAAASARVELARPFAPNLAIEAVLFAQLDAALDRAWEEQGRTPIVRAAPARRASSMGTALWLAAAAAAFVSGYFADAWRPAAIAARTISVDAVARDAYLPASWDSTTPVGRTTTDVGREKPRAP